MIKFSWVISEEEKSRIIDLHESATKKQYLVLEQVNQPFTIDFQNTFQSGGYNFNTQYEKVVNDSVRKIADYIKNKKLKNFSLIINASESQVPNQEGFKTPGSLAKKRAEVLENYLKQTLPSLLGFEPQIKIGETKIGPTKWDPNLGKDNEAYRNEQYVKVTVQAEETKPPTPTPYKRSSIVGEQIYMLTKYSEYLIGFISQPMVKTKDIKEPGFQPLDQQNLVFTEVKKDTVPFEILGEYQVPFSWWNNRPNAGTKYIDTTELDQIRKFKKL